MGLALACLMCCLALTRQAMAQEAAAPPSATARPMAWFDVGRIVLEYPRSHPDHVPVQELMSLQVALAQTPNGLVGPDSAPPTTTRTLAELSSSGLQRYEASAINAICEAIVGDLNRRGLISVVATPAEIDEQMRDRRTEGDRTLRIWILLGQTSQLRTLAGGKRVDDPQRINHPKHAWILEESPVKPGAGDRPGDLLRKDLIEDYIFRLSRHPGRRLDVALSAADETGGVVVDYQVTENKPLLLYAQISNTGTEQTERVRERFGLIHSQLTNFDDILSLDYITAGFDDAHALLAAYERPFGDVLGPRWRVFGSWSEYTASDVGFAGEDFEGESWSAGAELIFNLFQRGELFMDLIVGARWENIEVVNEAVFIEGEGDLFLPSIGVRLDRTTQIATTTGAVVLEFNLSDVSGTDKDELTELGRFDPDEDWVVLRWDATHSFFVEPVLDPRWDDPDAPGSKLAHEILGTFKGQYAFDNRLIPQAEQVVGGMYTVRGYPESLVAGDTVVIGSLEYRFHLPRALYRTDPEGRPGPRQLWPWLQPVLGESFRQVPQHPYGTTDWDLILKAFIDAGRVIISDPLFFEEDHTLVGAGVGVEFLFKRHLTLRLDWGFILEEIEELDANEGSNRAHFAATLLF